MASHPITAQVLQFIGDHIRSIEQLEILCLLAENASRSWTVPEVFRCIQSTEKSVKECLDYFAAEGLLTSDEAGGFRFAPRDRGVQERVLELVKSYRERRVTIIEAIYKKPPPSVQDFAAAFRLRKEK